MVHVQTFAGSGEEEDPETKWSGQEDQRLRLVLGGHFLANGWNLKEQKKNNILNGNDNNKTCVSSMIHSARPTVPTVMITLFSLELCFVLWDFEKWRTDNMCKKSDHYRPWLWVGLVDQYDGTKCHVYEDNVDSPIFLAVIKGALKESLHFFPSHDSN